MAQAAPGSARPAVLGNNNTTAAGRSEAGRQHIGIYAGIGEAAPHGLDGLRHEVAAFGEEGAGLTTPGPLIRVRAGTAIRLAVRNTLRSTLRVEGLCARPGPCPAISVAPGATQEVDFQSDTPGTYFYWATTRPGQLMARVSQDTQLGGAIVIDPRDGSPPDRVFVITAFGERPPPGESRAAETDVFAINGGSWPNTELLQHAVGDRVRWRILNLSFTPHPLHLHGAHFDVEAIGGIGAEQLAKEGERRKVVTEHVEPGRTFTMAWSADRPGNWLFHCHMTVHMNDPRAGGHASHGGASSGAGMAGLVLGIQVAGPGKLVQADQTPPRRATLVLHEVPNRYGTEKGYRVELQGLAAPPRSPGDVPGPTLVLTRGERAEITVVNRMTEPTAMHWHGIELDSYNDGVPGWSGTADSLAPAILPGEQFIARFTPSRAGTYIYHTHWHSDGQLSGGIYGALIVLEPGETFDPETDHLFIIGLNGVATDIDQLSPLVLNGSTRPAVVTMRAGVPNRLRLINITANNINLTAFLYDRFEQATWTPLAKDGAVLPAALAAARPARQHISVGETYDFEIRPSVGQQMWLELRRNSGAWVAQAPIRVR